MHTAQSSGTGAYRGPVFLVGMPRSGTKLLRAILNRHPAVAIPAIETEFLPYWVKHWPQLGDLSDRAVFLAFARSCESLPFFVYLAERGSPVDADVWYRRCRHFTPAGVFEGLIRAHLGLADESDTIWGDKSPSYLTHIPTLRGLYPEARFLHIVRDVRDYCLSINKAWGKNMYRAAQRWADDVAAARRAGADLPGKYHEVLYEQLLEDPAGAVGRVCTFLGIRFDPQMLELSKPTENLGDARGVTGIARSNVGKFDRALPARKRLAIERIALDTMHDTGYRCIYSGRSRRVSRLGMRIYQLADGISLLRFSMRERGLLGAIRFVSSYFRVSGNRQAPKEP